METETLLLRLSEAGCISGGEGAAGIALAEIRKYAPDARMDRGGIVAPVAPPAPGGEHLMLDAHLDEIGFVVTDIDPDGFLRAAPAGGADLRALPGREVTVYGREPLFGVFCCMPAARRRSRKSEGIGRLAVDIGLPREKAAELVSPGDRITLRRQPAELLDGRLTGKALDNRAGVVALLRALDLLGGEKPPAGLTVLLSFGEELGERGAKAAAFAIAPTQALVVDVSHALTPDAPAERCGVMGKGPMIGVSPVLDAGVTAALFASAREESIPFQTEAMAGGTGTNGDVVSVARAGVRTGLCSIPLRYMHTAAEMIEYRDVEATARLVAAYIRRAGRSVPPASRKEGSSHV